MATLLRQEIGANYLAFETEWFQELTEAHGELAGQQPQFEQSYVRIASIQAWRSSVVLEKLDGDSQAFFFEAQNDFLTSHCLAACGSFRPALKALRSALENVYFAVYYKDHPVELAKWNDGRHKMGFTELHSYIESHPAVVGNQLALNALAALSAEYSTLSRAVHGSAKMFRMTQNLADIRLWVNEPAAVGRWATREKMVISNLNVLLCHLFAAELLGTKNRALRESIGLVVPKAQHAGIRTALNVSLIA